MIAFFQQQMGRRFRALLCGDPSGVPPWLGAIADGEGPGFFLPGDAPWIIHGDMATLVGGVRALLMQALHPGTLAGVRDHSRYKADPLGRLAGTIQWLTVTTFASRESILREAARVRGMHAKVRGTYDDAGGQEREYKASDPDLLQWVHIAFMDSFLRCHQTYSPIPIPGGADAYIRLWAQSVEPLGLADTPRDEKALLFHAAYLTLPLPYQKMIGLRAMPHWLVVPTTRLLLRLIRLAIGSGNPIQEAAIVRLNRQAV